DGTLRASPVMPKRTPKSRRRIDGQGRRIRPGSILWIVVALLLLLTILGTAYLKVAVSTRVSSAQYTLDSAISIQLQGAGDAVTGVLADDLNDDWGNLHGNTRGTDQTF